MNRIKHILFIALFLFLYKIGSSQHRIIISSDFPPFPVTNSDPDDVQSMVRFHGPLCAIYTPKAMSGPRVIEGDSPAFLYLVSANRGINDPEDPTQPGWGGQYIRKENTNHYIDGPGGSSISRWKNDFQSEFRERADWCIN